MCCSYCLDIMFLVFMYINSFTCAHSSVPITIIVIIMHIVQCVWVCVFSEWACVCVCVYILFMIHIIVFLLSLSLSLSVPFDYNY